MPRKDYILDSLKNALVDFYKISSTGGQSGLFKVALDPCYNYVCIYFKSMHELR